jgi:hypothetical protein
MSKLQERARLRLVGLLAGGLSVSLGSALPSGARPGHKREVSVSNIVGLACIDREWPIEGDGCIFFRGQMLGGDYFRGMRRVDTADGPVFRKGTETMRYFPDEVSILMYAVPARCTGDGREYSDWIPPPEDLLKSVHAEAAYTVGLQRHPLEISLSQQGPLEEDPGVGGSAARLLKTWVWQYHYVIRTKGIELRYPVVVWLYLHDGTKLAQCPFRLAGPGRYWPRKSPK